MWSKKSLNIKNNLYRLNKFDYNKNIIINIYIIDIINRKYILNIKNNINKSNKSNNNIYIKVNIDIVKI